MPVANRQTRSPADPLDRVAGLPMALRAAVEASDDEPFAHGLQAFERLLERARHRDRPPRAPLRRRRLAVTGLLVHRDRLRDQINVLTPSQRLDLTAA